MRRLGLPQSAKPTQARTPTVGSLAVQAKRRLGPTIRDRIIINHGVTTGEFVRDGPVPGGIIELTAACRTPVAGSGPSAGCRWFSLSECNHVA